MTIERAAERGGSFGRIGRTWYDHRHLGQSAPAESSPVRSVTAARQMTLLIAAALGMFGIVALVDGVSIRAKAAVAQVLLRGAWERARGGAIAPKPWPWADTYPVARLGAPEQGVDLLVLAGATGRTLAFGPGHHDGSALPGHEGNVVLSGHRDTHFRFLRDVHVGEALVLETTDGRHVRYRVRDLSVIDYRELALSRWTRALTLVTCYPFEAIAPGGPLRYVVTATPEDQVNESRNPGSGNSP